MSIERIFSELDKAQKKHPSWPNGLAWPLTIIGEEYGEACQAAIEFEFNKAPLEDVRTELAQCAAMCLRTLIAIEDGDA